MGDMADDDDWYASDPEQQDYRDAGMRIIKYGPGRNAKIMYDTERTPTIGHVRVHPLGTERGAKRINEFLAQDRYWVDASLRKVRIKDMDSDYLLATMMFLIDRAPKLYLFLDLVLGTGGDTETMIPPTNGAQAIQYTALFQKMRQRYYKLTAD